MKIEKIATHADRAGRFSVRFEDQSVLRLYRQTLEDFSLYSGQELSPNEYSALIQAAGKMSAKMRAVRIVSAASVSKKDLEQRLIHKGETPEDAAGAVSWMSDLHLLDDQRTAEQIVHRCISKGYGVARAKQALFEKRIPKTYWDQVLEDYPDQSEAIVSFLRSRLGEEWDERDVRRATDALIRRGHSYHDIRRGLEQLSADKDFLEE